MIIINRSEIYGPRNRRGVSLRNQFAVTATAAAPVEEEGNEPIKRAVAVVSTTTNQPANSQVFFS